MEFIKAFKPEDCNNNDENQLKNQSIEVISDRGSNLSDKELEEAIKFENSPNSQDLRL